ncbi:hypothetical protein CYMTET_41263 [Cymbomonas tetramitiformis]|uniref:Uncharacterized protein n=1 Tax=Cymbomonas tetramitiformis TaxID=36881 RepID=A0AAE0C7V3_9CHLO|nr:hypothetical protein CYMTET_41263 [Cymbomonas tetramitiformis]
MYNPVTPQALAIVNGEFDLPGILDRAEYHKSRTRRGEIRELYESTGDQSELYSMTKHDLCFRETRSISERNRKVTMNDALLKVFSSFTKLPKWIQGKNVYENDDVVFVGVSQTQMMLDRARCQSAGVAIATAGKLTIMNTGSQTINPGDTVCWDFPFMGNGNQIGNHDKMNHYIKRAKYNDGNRLTAAVVPLNHMRVTLQKHYEALKETDGEFLKKRAGTIGFQHPTIYAEKRATERIIGKATTRALVDEPYESLFYNLFHVLALEYSGRRIF